MQKEVYKQNLSNFLQKQDRLDRAERPTVNKMLTQHAKTAALKLFLNCRSISLTVDGKKPLDIFLTEENRYSRTFVKGTKHKMTLLRLLDLAPRSEEVEILVNSMVTRAKFRAAQMNLDTPLIATRHVELEWGDSLLIAIKQLATQ